MRVGGATSQLDLPSLTPLSVAGCGRLQLGVPHWATSIYTLSGRTGSALAWRSEGRTFASQCSKSCDLQPALNCAIRGAQGILPCVGWGVRPVN